MEINIGVLNKQQAEATTGTKKMRLSKQANSMVFKLFTSNIYSNPIGTVVREITSNCFDSHVEAGVDHPVLIKKSYDAETETHHISFIDYGVGMSPDRIENVYGVYFESTKRTNNDEIGGFGIGGKTPLAYKRFIGEGEGEYDNSFFVITNYEGVKYYYNIYEGVESPEFSLFHKENTTERNGTEIRIPVLKKDIDSFERELLKQLYYFENLVFEGFSERYIRNDYKIVEGENFLYRGTGADNYIHVCLGRVSYPINYSTLGLSPYDYNIPIALKVPIGKINVTASREQLDYSESTIKYLKDKIFEAKEEIKTMLSKQYDNIVSLADYFEYKYNFGQLKLTNDIYLNVKQLINKNEISLANFRYYDLDMNINSEICFNLTFNSRRYGKKESRYYSNRFNGSYDSITKNNSVYHVVGDFKRKMIKQSWLKHEHERYYILHEKNINDSLHDMWLNSNTLTRKFPEYKKFVNSNEHKLLVNMLTEYVDIVRSHTTNYDDIIVPEWYREDFGKKKTNKNILNKSISIDFEGGYKERISIKVLTKFKGIIFYGTQDDKDTMYRAYRIFRELFNDKHIATDYSDWLKNGWGEKKGIMFATVAKNNVKYFNYCKNAHHINMFLFKMVRRKLDMIIENFANESISEKFNGLGYFYTTEIFKKVSPKWGKKVDEIIEYTENMVSLKTIRNSREYLKPIIDLDGIKPSQKANKLEKTLDSVLEIQKNNENVLSCINLPSRYGYYYNSENVSTLIEILKKVMSL